MTSHSYSLFLCGNYRSEVFYRSPQAEGGKDKDNVVVEYSLEEVSQPIGIAGYELSNALSKEYQRSLPTIETLESEVAKMMDIK